ncbi:C40 family peptidase [Thermicanus aegyptius]|uniref:C40 family peptidase n=1 Tax=Thermicanus aegyptius TaxID=94009 RepID=UPI000415927E|nr:C40 family peptidase [Thermicanus aegyptius]
MHLRNRKNPFVVALTLMLFAASFLIPVHAPSAAPLSKADQVVQVAKSLLGKPYKAGATGPYAFDNWAFTKEVFSRVGILLNDSVTAQAKQGILIPKGISPKPGDLVFFGYGPSRVIHVGIYMGNNQLIDAYQYSGKVAVHDATGIYKKYYLGARRVIQEENPSSDSRAQVAARVVEDAKKYLGVDYKLGADYDKDGSYKFDCSSFTQKVFADVGIKLPRTATQQRNVTRLLSPGETLQIGDLVFFDTDLSGGMNHVGIYIGNQEFIHASTAKGGKVQISRLDRPYWKKVYLYATRVF